MLAFAFVAFAGCGAGITDALSGTAGMYVQTEDELASSGLAGGPFLPASIDYDISNVGTIPMTWSASADQPWVDVTPSNGVLDSLQSESVAVTFAPAAAQLLPGSYTANVSFVNQTDSVGNTSRQVTLTVTAPGSQAMTTATRTTGPAPLAVHFDAVGSQSGVVQPAGPDPDHSTFAYEWDYGNPNSGNWPLTGKARNRGHGWLGAHVYETPGTYRVTLKVVNHQGTSFDYHQDITVTDPDVVYASRTYYVAANGSDSNTGTQALPFRTPERALQAVQGRTGPARIRLRRGDSFTCSNELRLSNDPHEILVDGYATGNRPIITFTGGNTGFITPAAHTTIHGLDLRQQSATAPGYSPGVSSYGQFTVSACRLHGFGYAIRAGSGLTTIANSEILDAGDYGMYLTPNNNGDKPTAILGNRLDNAISEHLVRTYTSKTLIDANLFQRANINKHAIKMVGGQPTNPQKHNQITRNTLESNCYWVVTIGPENSTSDQHLRHTNVDSNHFKSLGQNVALVIRDKQVYVRNNIFEIGNWPCIEIGGQGIGPTPESIKVEHNTAYAPAATSLEFIRANSANPTVMRNNIAFCPQGAVQTSGNLSASNNLFTDPLFTNAGTGDFTPSPQSSAIGAAAPSNLRHDLNGRSRPQGGGPEIGALERQ